MDHLTHIVEPNLPDLHIPYLGDDGVQYDGLGFLKFPERCGINIAEMLDASSLGVDIDSLAGFLQAHLFFGFLHEFFAFTDVKWGAGDFICEVPGGGSRITTCLLPTMIWFWVAEEVNRDPLERTKRFKIYSGLFDVAQTMFNGLVRKDRLRSREARIHNDSGSLILLSTSILIETLGMVFKVTYESFHQSKIIQPDPTPYSVDRVSVDAPVILVTRLKSAGWCSGEIENLEHEYLSNSSLYVLSRVHRAKLHREHGNCTNEQCNADQVDKTTYKTKHCEDKCECTFYPQVDDGTIEKICQILESGNLPLISISQSQDGVRGESLQVQVGTYNLGNDDSTVAASPSFVSISHVWADGKGNQTENSLPKCVLLDLQAKASALYPTKTTPTWFWLDTICIPIKEPFRRIGIERLVATYTKADKVLVLDKGLESLPKTALPEEKFINIRICGWMQRLWTLQEGWFAARLCFQFANGTLEPLEMIQACSSNQRSALKLDVQTLARCDGWNPAHRESLIRALVTDSHTMTMDPAKKRILDDAYRQCYPDLPTNNDKQLAWFINRSIFYDPVVQDAIPAFNKIRMADESLDKGGEVFTALKGRTTSRLEDEPICISNLLGMDPRPIIREKPSDRMKLLLRTIKALPVSIIFSHGARMPDPGYRWAPKTFLVPNSFDYRHANNACFRDECLTFHLPGAALNLNASLPHDDQIGVYIGDKQFSLELFSSDDAESTWDYYQDVPMMLILRRPMKDRGPYDGVLVSLQKTVDDTFWVLYERTVWISQDYTKEHKRFGNGIFLSGEQQWCITDTPERVVKRPGGVRHILTKL